MIEDTVEIKQNIAKVTEAEIKVKTLEYRKLYPRDLRDDRSLRPYIVKWIMRNKRPV